MAGKQPGRRKPAHLKVLEGVPGKRPVAAAPQLAASMPDPPAWLPEDARQHYTRLAPILREAGVLTDADRDALADLCLCLVRLEQAEELVERDGLVVSDGKGGLKKHPAVNAAKEYRAHLQAWAKRFGLDPYSRGALDVKPPGDEKDPLEELLETR